MHLKWLDAEYFQVWDGDTALKGFQGLTAKIVINAFVTVISREKFERRATPTVLKYNHKSISRPVEAPE